MKITSPAFLENEEIPKEYTCEGENYNPPLTFNDIPENTKSLALIFEDPDAVSGIWYHWILFNIPPQTRSITQNSRPESAIEGLSTGRTNGYESPCPPNPKSHRYIFNLYALDQMFDFSSNIDAPTFKEKIKGHIIEEAKLTGIYTGPAKRI